MPNYLLITSAHKNDDFEERKSDYLKSINKIINYKNFFDKIFILECLSKKESDLDYLKLDDKIEIYFSEIENFYINYGLNELLHINNFLQKSNQITDTDNIVKITGRYFLENDNFLKLLPTNYDIIAKKDGDIWGGDKGVHTFYMIFKKNFFNKMVVNIDLTEDKTLMQHYCIEWYVKEFMLKNSNIHFFNEKMGILTNFSNVNNLKILV